MKLLLSIPDTKSKIGLRDKTLLSVMYASGARAQEMCNLTVADVRFDKEVTTLTLKGKGGKYRYIGIPSAPANILRQYIAARGIERHLDEFVFPSQTHAQMTVSCVEGIFKNMFRLPGNFVLIYLGRKVTLRIPCGTQPLRTCWKRACRLL